MDRRPAGGLALRLAPGLWLSLAACSFTTRETRWTEQLDAGGPCWTVNLSDGLDEASTSELRDLYDCLNRQGALSPLGETMSALESEGRDGLPPGTDVARLVNRLPELDLDLPGLLSTAIDLVSDPDRPLQTVLQAAVELIYAEPWSDLPTLAEQATDPALADGLALPALDLLQRGAAHVVDADGQPLPLLAEVVADAAIDDMICTAAGLVQSEDPTVAALAEGLPAAVAETIERSRDGSNDRWSEASGDSIRDLLIAGLASPGSDGQTVIQAAADPLLNIVGDPYAVANLTQTLDDSRRSDRLALLPSQLRHLSQIDRAGGSLSGQEDSALFALLRLLDQANTDVSCSVDILVTELRIDLGNLSVSLLSFLADQDPETAADGVGLIGDVLGWGLSETTLDLIASSGACPVIDDQLVADLAAIDRLGDPEVRDLLVVLLSALNDLRAGEQDRLPDLVDLVSVVQQRGLVRPLEELLADVGSSTLAATLVEVVGLGLDPSALQVDACPEGSQPLSFEGMLGLVQAALSDRLGGSPLERLDPLIQVLLLDEQTWRLLGNLGRLARAEDARLFDLPALIVEGMDGSSTVEARAALAEAIDDPTWTAPILRLAEHEPLHAALTAAGEEQAPGPLPWMARLIVGGTLDAVLRTIELVFDALALEPDQTGTPATARTPSP